MILYVENSEWVFVPENALPSWHETLLFLLIKKFEMYASGG